MGWRENLARSFGPGMVLLLAGAVYLVAWWWTTPLLAAVAALAVLAAVFGPMVEDMSERGESWTGWRVRVSPAAWYRYGRAWSAVVDAAQLGVAFRGKVRYPRLMRVERWAHLDRLTVKLPLGMAPTRMRAVAVELGHSYRRLDCRVRSYKPGLVHVDMMYVDLLEAVVDANLPAVDDDVDFEALTIGLKETGEPWVVKLLGTHWLIGGATGAGKGSVLWSLILATGPAIRTGLCQWWIIDPKGGMEFGGPGEPLYHRFAADDAEGQAKLLRDLVGVMRARQAQVRGKTRKVEPSLKHPLVCLVIDEFAAIVSYSNGSKQLRWEMVHHINLLLTQGRALGIVVVGALQDARKSVLENRDLFPTRVALRLDDPDTVLGRGAGAKGARTAEVRLPGVGFAWEDGSEEPMRTRAGFVSDTTIAKAAGMYAPARRRNERALPVEVPEFEAPPGIEPGFAEVIDLPWAAARGPKGEDI